MGDFFVYILKSSACLASFYLFYRLLLSRETFHRFNRVALLSVIVFSIVIPFIQVVTEETAVIQRPVQNLEYLLQMAQLQTEVETPTGQSIWLPLLFLIYFAGCLFFFIRFLYSTFRIFRIIRNSDIKGIEAGVKLAITSEQISPFSWMGYVVISQNDMEESGREIFIHELAHIRARHSWDMLICSFCIIFQWFNPATWLLKQELQNIHEYEADETVINNGVDAKHYQLLLIKKAVGPQRFTSLANSFNHSKLKKRITMMLKQKSSPWARLKYLYILPLTALAVVAFARPEISRELEKISSVKIKEIVPVKETVVQKKVEITVPPKEKKQIQVTKTEKNVAIQVVGAKMTDSLETDAEPIESVEVTLQNQLENFSDQAKAIRQKSNRRVEASQYLILIDNEVSTYDQLDQISPENIKSFSISPKNGSEDVLSRYNAEAKKGIISVTTKTGNTSGEVKKEENVHILVTPQAGPLDPVTLRLRNQKSSENPLFIVDGKEMSDFSMDKLDPNNIESLSILKDKSANEIYGTKGKNGVIIVTTKNKK